MDNAREAGRVLRRTIEANVTPQSLFATFTFAKNVLDLDEAHARWSEFMRKFRKVYKGRYTAVIEFQKRGAVHFHVLFYDAPAWMRMERQTRAVANIWGHGFVDIAIIDGLNRDGVKIGKIGAYVSKYMTKGTMDARLAHRRAVYNSIRLERWVMRKVRHGAPSWIDGVEPMVYYSPIKGVIKYYVSYSNESEMCTVRPQRV